MRFNRSSATATGVAAATTIATRASATLTTTVLSRSPRVFCTVGSHLPHRGIERSRLHELCVGSVPSVPSERASRGKSARTVESIITGAR